MSKGKYMLYVFKLISTASSHCSYSNEDFVAFLGSHSVAFSSPGLVHGVVFLKWDE